MSVVCNRQGYLVGQAVRECTRCGDVYVYFSRDRHICPVCNMLKNSKSRANRTGLEFNLAKKDIDIPSHCPILGLKLGFHTGKAYPLPNTPSIDRKNNSIGYLPDNIWVISHMANTMKGGASEEELVLFSEWIINEYGKQHVKE